MRNKKLILHKDGSSCNPIALEKEGETRKKNVITTRGIPT